MNYEPIEHEPLYMKVKKRLLVDITAENSRMLPNEKTLMARYGVSRNTLLRAIAELTKENILKPVQGVGTIIYPLPEIKKHSNILVLCGEDIKAFQQETFNKLLSELTRKCLIPSVVLIDKENIDFEYLDIALQKSDAVVLDMHCSFSDEIIERINFFNKKAICLKWNARNINLSYVSHDIEGGAYQLASHLLELGHREIRFISNVNDKQRIAGIKKAFRDFGLDDSDKALKFYPVESDSRQESYLVTKKLLESEDKFTALMAQDDFSALGIQEAILEKGLRVPEDIAIVGFDNQAESENYLWPLTTCAGNKYEMIRKAIEYLFDNSKDLKPMHLVVNSELIIRESTIGKQK